MEESSVNFSKRPTPAPDWASVAPELARAGRGRRTLLLVALVGITVNGIIGALGVLMPQLNDSLMDMERGYWVSAALAATSVLMIILIVWAARRQNSEQAMLLEVFYGVINPQAVMDASGRLLLANRAYMAWLGARGDNVEQTLYQYFANDAGAVSELERLITNARNGTLSLGEVKHRLPGGDTEWRRIIARPLPGWHRHVIVRLEDVSDRRRIEERLREEQHKLVDFLSQAPVGIYSVDQNGLFVFVNQTLADWLGCSVEELTSGNIRLHDILAKPPLNAPAHALTNGPEGERRGDLILRGLQGRNFPVSITQTVVRSPDGLEVLTRSVVRDLTPEQRWQEALSLSEQRFQRLFTDAPVGIVLVDDQIRIVECNQAFAHLASVAVPDLLTRDFTTLLPAADRAPIHALLTSQLKEGEAVKPFEILVGEEGRQRSLQVFIRRFTTAQTTRGGLMLHFIDATEQKKLQHQFVQSQKMQAVGQLAGGVAHDFNNLLTAMIGFCDLLLLRHRPGDQSFNDLMQIKQNANRAANLVRQLLAFSRQQTLQPQILNLTDELADLNNMMRRLIPSNVEMRIVNNRDIWPLKVDRMQLEQVVINLAVNGRDAMQPKGGVLTISSRNHVQEKPVMRGQEEQPPGDYVTIDVTDEGHGIPPEIMQKIFEPFFSTKEIGAGTGLGLSTVMGIVRQAGGFVAVQSTVGKGTTFSVMFPRYYATPEEMAALAAAATAKEEAPVDLTGAGTVLLVEDEDAVRTFGSRALKNKGYTVLEAHTGEEAMMVLDQHIKDIDVIVSDVVMPQMDGPTMAKTARAKYPEDWKRIKMIFVSGYTEDRLREQFEAGEKFGFLGKPFTLKQLAEKVKEEMGR